MLRFFRNMRISSKILLTIVLLTVSTALPFLQSLNSLIANVQLKQGAAKYQTEFVLTLELIQRAALELELLTHHYNFDANQANVEGTEEGDAKYKILAYLDDIAPNRTLKQFAKGADEDKQREIKVISDIMNAYASNVLHLVDLAGRAKNKDVQIESTQAVADLKKSNRQLQKVVTQAISNARPILSAAINSVSEETASIKDFYTRNFLISIILSIILVFFLSRAITKPIRLLAKSASDVAAGKSSSIVSIDSTEEVGQLSKILQSMMRELKEANQKLLVSVRQAGMAEVAVHVLHNIGNILNSANTSVHLLQTKTSSSSARHLAPIVGQLEANRERIGEYLSKDERGQLILPFLANMVKNQQSEQEVISHELAVLVKNLDLIKEVVSSQQKLANPARFVEQFTIGELIKDLNNMTSASMTSKGVEFNIIQRANENLEFAADKSKLQQILHNLVSNAKESALSGSAQNKKVELLIEQNDEGHMRFAITDNGIGFDEETHKKLFSFAFTTKETGNGFGLHFCALAVKEMGGEIKATSPGPGQGATFELAIPLKKA